MNSENVLAGSSAMKRIFELEQSIRTLREDNKQHEDFIEELSGMLPPSYDADEAVEAIILRFVKDMTELGRIVAKLTADYR